MQKRNLRKRLYEVVDMVKVKDRIASAYNSVMMCLIVISMIPLCFKTSNIICVRINVICTAAFIMDYPIRWLVADFKGTGNKIVAFLRYPFTPYALLAVCFLVFANGDYHRRLYG